MKLPEKVKNIFTSEPVHQLATSSKTGIPNVCSVGAKYLFDDETIIIVDNYFKKTLSNIIENPVAAILIRSGKESYQIKGKCAYVTSGPVYEAAKRWMKAVGEKYPAKGALEIKVEEIFNSAAGSGSGDSIADPQASRDDIARIKECFVRACKGIKIVSVSDERTKTAVKSFSKLSLQSSPPEIARLGYSLLRTICSHVDPYRQIKRKSNRCALRLFGKLKDKVDRSKNRLLTAAELAIAGNIIDFGAKNNLNVKEELKKILAQEKKAAHKRSLFHYAEFRHLFSRADMIISKG